MEIRGQGGTERPGGGVGVREGHRGRGVRFGQTEAGGWGLGVRVGHREVWPDR